MFDKTAANHPVRETLVYLAHCAVSPLLPAAFEAERAAAEGLMRNGLLSPLRYAETLDGLRAAAAGLLSTAPENLAFVKNTTEGMGLVANGFPFEAGDRIVSYVHEYPANHYPWRLQEARGVGLDLAPNANPTGLALGDRPCAWRFEDLVALCGPRTRVVAVSHVQFTSGFAADLKRLGAFCRDRGIALVVDAAQSLGSLPVRPEEWGVDAVVASGWKWLMGPVGTGLLYTAPAFRALLAPVLAGAEAMVQGDDYLDHRWNPHASAKRFEYSTSPVTLAAALKACFDQGPLGRGVEAVRDEIFRLQDAFAAALDPARYTPVRFEGVHRSGILALLTREDPEALVREAMRAGVVVTARGGYVRVAPHVYLTDEDMARAARFFNDLSS